MTTPAGGLAHELGERATGWSHHTLPNDVASAVTTTFMHALATAIGGCRHEAIDILADLGTALQPQERVVVPGRLERLGPIDAAYSIAAAAHHDDFDDTHLATVIHPGAATLAAVWTAAHCYAATGAEVLRAFGAGVEVQLRIGQAMSPWHYDDGWHITSTCGVIGTAVAAGMLAELDTAGLAHAMAIAASSTVGLRGTFGSMTKPLHPGKAAANGLIAADLVRNGFVAVPEVFDIADGFFATLSPRGSAPDRVLADWGSVWQVTQNTFKAYPTGVVAQPVIDAAIDLSTRVDADDITDIRARVHPLVRVLTGNADPRDTMQAQISTPHGVAVALSTGRAGLAEYAEDVVADPAIARLRACVELVDDELAARDSAQLTVTTRDGAQHTSSVAHARGSLARPLTTDEFAAKCTSLIDATLPGRADAILAAAVSLAAAPRLTELAALCAADGLAAA